MTLQRQPARRVDGNRLQVGRGLLAALMFGIVFGAAPSAGAAEPLAAPAQPAAAPGVNPPVAVAPPAAPAAQPAPKAGPNATWLRKDSAPKPAPGSGSMSVVRYTLFGVVLFGLSLYALYRHQRRGRGLLPAARSALTLEGAVRVGPKAQVVVVNVAGRKLLLGVTESEVSRLAWLDDAIEPDAETVERPELAPARPTAQERGYGATAQERGYAASAQERDGRRAPAAPASEVLPVRAPIQAAFTKAQPKRFRDALLGALGHRPQTDHPESAAAVAIAESTQDVVQRSQRQEPTAPIAAPPGAPDMVDVEGQARGLVMRLQKRA